MRARAGLLAAALLSACATPPATRPLDVAVPPPGAFGTAQGEPEVAALDLARSAFADSSRTYGRPAEAARAVAALDYLAGALSMEARWAGMPARLRAALLQARADARQAVGVRPGAASQQVVDRLTAAATALDGDDRAGALRVLEQAGPGGPVFDGSGDAVLARLANLPYLRLANAATAEAAERANSPDGGIAIMGDTTETMTAPEGILRK